MPSQPLDPKSRAKRDFLNHTWSLYKMYGEEGYGSARPWWTQNQNHPPAVIAAKETGAFKGGA